MELQKQVYKDKGNQNPFFKLIGFIPNRLFAALTMLRTQLYKWEILQSQKLPGKCISIGNICLGGTGKTPVVIELAKFIHENRKQVLILTRGYKSGLKKHEYVVLKDGEVCASNRLQGQIFADEAMHQSKTLPYAYVIVAAKRFKAAEIFLSEFPFKHDDLVFILDDGYQHQQIHRDLNILLVDSEKPIGNGQMLPLGTLREPIKAVSRCDMIVWTRCNKVKNPGLGANRISELLKKKVSTGAQFIEGKIYKVSSRRLFETGYNELKNLSLLAVTGIAHPHRFFKSVEQIGLKVEDRMVFNDHQRFDLKMISEKFSHLDALLITAKDYWREPSLFQVLPISVFILDLEIKFTNTEFFQPILDLITD